MTRQRPGPVAPGAPLAGLTVRVGQRDEGQEAPGAHPAEGGADRACGSLHVRKRERADDDQHDGVGHQQKPDRKKGSEPAQRDRASAARTACSGTRPGACTRTCTAATTEGVGAGGEHG
ncbi:MAG TPA: hypothetical protein VKQ71_15460, partial [Acidimicrobiales bacterium]|nr:hypothetical protein [Acidimicrobiales bacterium]